MAIRTKTSKESTESTKEPVAVDETYRVNVHGTENDDVLYGNAGDNKIYGLGGNDTFYGDPGSDQLHGSDDTDTANYKYSTGGVKVDLLTGDGWGGYAEGDSFFDIENVTGSNYRDYLFGDNYSNVLDGGSGHDTLFGRGGTDTLYGGYGDDTLEGGADADILNGGKGSDTASYTGSSSGVTVNLGSAWSQLSSGPYGSLLENVGANSAHGGDAAGDTLTSIENVTGSSHDDLLIGNDGTNVLTGGSGHDRLFGRDGDDTLRGGDGDDVLVAGWGVDTLDGGEGRDEVSYADYDGGVIVNLNEGHGGDRVWGVNSADRDTYSSIEDVTGSNYNDIIYGSDAANELKGLGGYDFLFGGAGADVLDGGAGIDVTSYNESDAAVTVDLAAGTGAGGHAQGDTLISIEKVTGSLHDGNHLYGNSDANTITSSGDHDVVDGREGADTINAHGSDADVWGGEGADYINAYGSYADVRGGEGDDAIWVHDSDADVSGGDGADYLHVLGTNSVLSGGDGEDVIVVAGNGTEVDAGADNDLIYVHWSDGGGMSIDGGSGEDALSVISASSYSYPGVDYRETIVNLEDGTMTRKAVVETESGYGQWETTLDSINSIENVYGHDKVDKLYGDGASNVFAGGAGDDVLSAFGGDDVLYGGAGADELYGGEGVDTANYSTLHVWFGDQQVSPSHEGSEGVNVSLGSGAGFGGHAEGDTLTGIENLVGTSRNDVLEGDANDNIIWGDGGDDILNGAGGSDVLTGDQGADTFKFELDFFGEDTGRITDFEQGVDQIDLRGLDYFTSMDQVFENIEAAGSATELNYGQSSIMIEGTQFWELGEQDFLL